MFTKYLKRTIYSNLREYQRTFLDKYLFYFELFHKISISSKYVKLRYEIR